MLPSFPAPYLVVDDFLTPEDHRSLLAWTLAQEQNFSAGALGSGVVDPDFRRCLKIKNIGPHKDLFAAKLTAAYPSWLQQLKLSSFPLDRVETNIAAYADGGHFGFHVDTAPHPGMPASTRMLTAVYYFHTEPKAFTEGEIRLYPIGAKCPTESFRAIPPQQNSLLVFPSWIGHQVMPIRCPGNAFADSRFAVNCWLHKLSLPMPQAAA